MPETDVCQTRTFTFRTSQRVWSLLKSFIVRMALLLLMVYGRVQSRDPDGYHDEPVHHPRVCQYRHSRVPDWYDC